MWKGWKKPLNTEDIYEHLPQDESELQLQRLKVNWNRELRLLDDVSDKTALHSGSVYKRDR